MAIAGNAFAVDGVYNDTINNSCNIDFLGVAMGNATNNFTAEYSPIPYTCNAGQYLYSDDTTVECRQCPTNSYCGGGTYTIETADTSIALCPTGTFSAPGTASISECMEPKFTATYSGTSAGFEMTAGGTFYIDWGDGTVQKITRNVTGHTTYSHTYSQSGSHNVRFAGQATGYSTTTQSTHSTINYNDVAISFAGQTNLTGISGSLGSIFSTIGDGGTLATQPRFAMTFRSCTNLRGSIPAELFTGVHGQPVRYMFNTTFWNTKLSGNIPPLFKDLSGSPAEEMFANTFYGLSGLTGSIPSGLFGNLSGSPAENMFKQTFCDCSGLTGSIPSNLFGNLSGTPAAFMFGATFYGCSGLTGSIPSNLFGNLSGAPAENMFSMTFYGCSGLTGSIPSNLFGNLSGAPAENMFIQTFVNCSNLTGSIPSNLFGNLSGTPAAFMFGATFYGCSGLTGSIPSNLFGNLSGAPAEYMFRQTFNGASNLTGYIPTNLFGTISGARADYDFYLVFDGTSLETSCPANNYRHTFEFQDSFSNKVGCDICPDDGLSDAGSTAITQCYITCPEPQPVEHGTSTLIGDANKFYVNNAYPQCEYDLACDTGYHNNDDMTACLANLLSIDWKSDGELYQQNTCTYDGDIVLPTPAPVKAGYTFAGWKLIVAEPAAEEE